MAHFARLDENNLVVAVLKVADADTADEEGTEVESIGVAFLEAVLGRDDEEGTTYVQTSYNNNMRGRYAGIGYTWHPELGADGLFVPPSQGVNFTLGADGGWVNPVPRPDPVEGKFILWNDTDQTWDMEDDPVLG